MIRKQQDNNRKNRLDQLTAMIVELKEEQCLADLQHMLDEGVPPADLMSCCMEGMRQVGVRFEKGIYFIAALIMAGEIMRLAMEILSPHLQSQDVSGNKGKILIATVQGDIHDLGKNLFTLLLKGNGIDVIDLGIDVRAEVVLDEVRTICPDLVGLSCILTNSVENLKNTVKLLRTRIDSECPPIIVGGTCMDERMARYVGDCIWARDAAAGLLICQEILSKKQL